MRIIDVDSNQEVTSPDTTVGYVYGPIMWASPEAYETIDDETKFALDKDDYEKVLAYHKYTDEEMAAIAEQERLREQQEIMDSLPDAMADLSEMVSSNTIDMEGIMDAIADLSEVVSQLVEGE